MGVLLWAGRRCLSGARKTPKTALLERIRISAAKKDVRGAMAAYAQLCAGERDVRGYGVRVDSVRGDSVRGDSVRGHGVRGDSVRGDSVREHGVRGDSVGGRVPYAAYAGLVAVHAHTLRLPAAMAFLGKLKTAPDVPTTAVADAYAHVVSAYVAAGQHWMAAQLFDEMANERVGVTHASWNAVLRALLASAVDRSVVERVLLHAKNARVTLSRDVWRDYLEWRIALKPPLLLPDVPALLRQAVKWTGHPPCAKTVGIIVRHLIPDDKSAFDLLHDARHVANALLASQKAVTDTSWTHDALETMVFNFFILHLSKARLNDALLFVKMMEPEFPMLDEMPSVAAPKPNAHTFTIVMNAFLAKDDVNTAHDVFSFMLKQSSIQPTTAAFSSLIAAYAKRNDFPQCIQLYQKSNTLLSPDIYIHTTMMSVYSRMGDLSRVLSIWSRHILKKSRGQLHKPSYAAPVSVVLDAAGYIGSQRMVEKIWSDVVDHSSGYELVLCDNVWNSYIEALMRRKAYQKAVNVFKRMLDERGSGRCSEKSIRTVLTPLACANQNVLLNNVVKLIERRMGDRGRSMISRWREARHQFYKNR